MRVSIGEIQRRFDIEKNKGKKKKECSGVQRGSIFMPYIRIGKNPRSVLKMVEHGPRQFSHDRFFSYLHATA